MKKALSLALCGVLICSLAGCAGKQAAEEQTPAASETPIVSEQVNQVEETKSPAQELVQSSENNDEIRVIEQSLALSDLSDNQLTIFKETSQLFLELALDGVMTIDELDEAHRLAIEAQIIVNELPVNGQELYDEWKELNNYYDQFDESSLTDNTVVTEPSVSTTTPVEDQGGNSSTPSQSNKPQPSTQQQQQQQQQQQASSNNEDIYEDSYRSNFEANRDGFNVGVREEFTGDEDGYEGGSGKGGSVTRFW